MLEPDVLLCCEATGGSDGAGGCCAGGTLLADVGGTAGGACRGSTGGNRSIVESSGSIGQGDQGIVERAQNVAEITVRYRWRIIGIVK